MLVYSNFKVWSKEFYCMNTYNGNEEQELKKSAFQILVIMLEGIIDVL